MTIMHTVTKADATYRTVTTYEDNHLTRIINSKIAIVDMKHKNTIADLNRLTSLDDESFGMMADLQKTKANRT